MLKHYFEHLRGSEVTIKCPDTSTAYMTFQMLLQALGLHHVAWQQVRIENLGERHEVTFSMAKDDADNGCIVMVCP